MQFMESSGKVDGKVAPSLHKGDFRGSMYKGSIGKIGKCIIVNMPMSSEMLIGLIWHFTEINFPKTAKISVLGQFSALFLT